MRYLLVDDERLVDSIRWESFEMNTGEPYKRVDVPREFLVVAGISVTDPYKIKVIDHSMDGDELKLLYERQRRGGDPYDQPRYSYNMTKWNAGLSPPRSVSVEVVDEYPRVS